ncbi:MAG TPA: DUF86 domain-containing protein [Methanobacterium subterraneum]|uniref:DUF86 domain-containing protein n=1 Tax=Methanobacterium subterraneum TaxID=59277 RepID=A0A7J4TL70_9EURY|nr:DUF86 domain-containing protein [Methanobacterium subterraneum]
MRTDIIRNKLKEIEESVDLVRNHLPPDFDDFLKLGLVKDGIYKRIEYSIENVWDICSIINSDLTQGIPYDENNIPEKLIKAGILDREMGDNIKLMKGFRNIVVHRYGTIDDKVAFQTLQVHLEDFHAFIRLIEDFLDNNI